jgi:hypothetical protein
MKTLLLLILAFAVVVLVWGFGVGVCFVVGGFITTVFHASDTGLALFILASIAWTVWLTAKLFGGLVRAYRS